MDGQLQRLREADRLDEDVSGRPMPCDPEIIRFTKGGTQAYVTPDGFVIHGTPKQDGELMGYISHFATCPKANGFRKG